MATQNTHGENFGELTLYPQPGGGRQWKQLRQNWWGGAVLAPPSMAIIGPAKVSAEGEKRFAADPQRLERMLALDLEYAVDLVRSTFLLPASTAVFFERSDALAASAAQKALLARGSGCMDMRNFDRDFDALDDQALVRFILETVESGRDQARSGRRGLILPHVSETGRILPVAAIRSVFPAGGEVSVIVDGTQAIGRLDASQVCDPLSFCDAYFFSGQKAMGGINGCTALLLRQDAAAAGKVQQGAIRLPWLTAFREAVRTHFYRGAGNDYEERRRHQLAVMRHKRDELLEVLTSIPQIEILQRQDRPCVDSIVSFRTRGGADSELIAGRLLGYASPVTTSGVVAGWVRLDIPEYRSLPSTAVLKLALEQSL